MEPEVSRTPLRRLKEEVVISEVCDFLHVDFGPFRRKSGSMQAEQFCPMSWYCEPVGDALFNQVKIMFYEVDLTISHNLLKMEKTPQKYQGRATQYMLLKDQKLHYDQIFALYLIDMADICQHEEVIEAINSERNGEFDSLQFYKVMCVFI